MKKVLLGTVFGLAVAYMPADAWSQSGTSPAASTYNWTGYYVGINGGGAWGKGRNGGNGFDSWSNKYTEDGDPFFDYIGFTDPWSPKAFGFLFGGQVGYNHQFSNNFLIGLEADIQWSNIKAKGNFITELCCDSEPETFDGERGTEIKWFATVRGRVGYAFDQVLVYATGGAAIGKVNLFANNYSFDGESVIDSSYTTTRLGWTAGGGLEWAFRKNWSFKTEYLFVDLGTVTANPFATNEYGDYEVRSTRVRFHVFRGGLNYRFWPQ